jgi:hypothetical protein
MFHPLHVGATWELTTSIPSALFHYRRRQAQRDAKEGAMAVDRSLRKKTDSTHFTVDRPEVRELLDLIASLLTEEWIESEKKLSEAVKLPTNYQLMK